MVMQFIAADSLLQNAGMVFDLAHHDQRRDLVHAVRFLIEIGLLRRMDGNERDFLDQTGSRDALYGINRPILAQMLNVARSPSAFEAAVTSSVEQGGWKEFTGEPVPVTDDERNRHFRIRLVRALLDDPIVYFADLSSAELDHLQNHRGRLLQQIQEATGLIPEIRREGIAMVDDAGDLTDVKLPDEGTDGHMTLLLAERIAETARNFPSQAIPLSVVEEHVRTLIQNHGARWRKVVREPGAEMRVANDILARLRSLRLLKITDDGIIPLPAIGRYGTSDGSDRPSQ
jgi:uncharacterized protein (TIGR02678 family)